MLQPQFIILPIVVSVGYLVSELLIWLGRDDDLSGPWWVGWSGAGVSTLLLIITAIVFLPYNGKYYTYNHVAGTVESVSNRFIQGSGDASYNDFVVKLAGHPGVYNVQDDRIQGTKIGDHVDLTCTVQWVIAGQDQNNCFIRSW